MLLSDATPGTAAHDALTTIDEEIRRITGLANTLVAFGRETGEPGEPFFVNDLVRTVAAFFGIQVKHAKVTLETDLSPEVGAVEGHRERLKQVFLNLMLNALAAMDEGDTLRVATRPSEDGETVEIRFRDTGHGIAEGDVPRIFDVHFTTRADQGGTGIGLALSRDYVRQMNGELELEETSPAGTTFLVRLPLARTA
jgi:signal transduction histidine kinase